VVVVDPKYAATWPALEAEIHRLTDQPITHVILTHAHPDHAGAVEVLPPGVEVIGQLNAIRRVTAFGWLHGRGATPNVRVFADQITLFTGDDTVTLRSYGPAHTDGDTLVQFHQARVLHAGDLFPDTVAPIANIEGGGNGVGLGHTLTTAAAAIHDVDQVITGHGTVMTWDDFRGFAAFVQGLVDYVRATMGFGSDKNAVFKAAPIPPRFAGYKLDRLFNTLDEIDRSIRPRWQRIF
jgi:glyoxylase-like metal-dependent hydrolase (beta-lactamase superfamily II)